MIVYDSFRKYISGQTAVIAVSGGLDSMVLLHIFMRCVQEFGGKIVAVTVNHHIRNEESDADAMFVANYCRENGVECRVCHVYALEREGEKGFNLEEEARILRYAQLRSVAKEVGADYIATAHHATDNAESVLLNLFRGAGNAGVAGMCKEGEIIRPLLPYTQEQVAEYATAHSVPYRLDSSNLNNTYQRNFLRNHILPQIAERFPSAVRNISAFSERASVDEAFIAGFVQGIEVRGEQVFVPLNLLQTTSVGVRAIRQALELLGESKDVTALNFRDVLGLAGKGRGKLILLKRGVVAVREKGFVVIKKQKEEV